MFPDKCAYRRVISSLQFGEKTYGPEAVTPCYVETEDVIKPSNTGKAIHSKRLFMLPSSVCLQEGDEIKALKVGGLCVEEDYHEIDVCTPIGMGYIHHWEAYLK